MPVYKDDGNGTFYVQCYYRDARGSEAPQDKARLLLRGGGRSVGEPVQEP